MFQTFPNHQPGDVKLLDLLMFTINQSETDANFSNENGEWLRVAADVTNQLLGEFLAANRLGVDTKFAKLICFPPVWNLYVTWRRIAIQKKDELWFLSTSTESYWKESTQ